MTNREYQIVLITLITLVVKYFRSVTFEHFLRHLFVYGKTGATLLFMFQDYRLGIWYLIYCLCTASLTSAVIWLYLRIPNYSGPHKLRPVLSTEHLQSILAERTQMPGKEKMGCFKLVLFVADWSETCLYVRPEVGNP